MYVIFSLKQNGAKIQLKIPDLKKLKKCITDSLTLVSQNVPEKGRSGEFSQIMVARHINFNTCPWQFNTHLLQNILKIPLCLDLHFVPLTNYVLVAERNAT